MHDLKKPTFYIKSNRLFKHALFRFTLKRKSFIIILCTFGLTHHHRHTSPIHIHPGDHSPKYPRTLRCWLHFVVHHIVLWSLASIRLCIAIDLVVLRRGRDVCRFAIVPRMSSRCRKLKYVCIFYRIFSEKYYDNILKLMLFLSGENYFWIFNFFIFKNFNVNIMVIRNNIIFLI